MKKNIRNFTLIELLLMIAIITALAGMVLPALTRARAKGRSVFCMSNTRQLGFALGLYSHEHDRRLPDFKADDDAFPCWQQALAPYCGADVAASENSIWRCPDVAPEMSGIAARGGGYGANLTLRQTASRRGGLPLSLLARPSRLAVLGDTGRPTAMADGKPLAYTPRTTWATRPQPTRNWLMPDDLKGADGDAGQPAARHHGAANLVFADSHAEVMGFASLDDPANREMFFFTGAKP